MDEKVPQCYVDLMKRCWHDDPSKRPAMSEVRHIIYSWVDGVNKDDNEIDQSFKDDIMEFRKADEVSQRKRGKGSTISKTINNKPITKSHPQAYNTSRLLGFVDKLSDDQSDGYDIGNYCNVLNEKI